MTLTDTRDRHCVLYSWPCPLSLSLSLRVQWKTRVSPRVSLLTGRSTRSHTSEAPNDEPPILFRHHGKTPNPPA